MRLPRQVERARIPASPLFGVALLSFACLAPAVLSSFPRGVELGFEGETGAAGHGRAASVVWIRLLPGDQALVDGAPASLDAIAARVAERLSRDPETLVVLDVRPDVSFQAMIAAYDRLERIDAEHGGPIRNLAIPTQRDVREYIERHGVDPSEVWSRPEPEPSDAGG
jgi:hypothetical protein